MRPSTVVVRGPFADDRAQMTFAERNDPVEAFAAKRSDEALAEGIRFRTARRRFEDGEIERARYCIERGGEDRIAIVQSSISLVQSCCGSEIAEFRMERCRLM